MTISTDKIFGSLLGLVLADAMGARFEGSQPDHLREEFRNRQALFDYALQRESLLYTDDGQMALALTEYLSENSTIEPRELMRGFVQAYEAWRGYGRGARAVIEAFRDDAEYEYMAEHLFPGGSLGNGGAMRSAPVGLRFADDHAQVWSQAKQSAWPTHRHELGIEGAQLIALSTALAATESEITPAILAGKLLPYCSTIVFTNRLNRLSQIEDIEDIAQFGNGIEAHESVVTAIACFSLFPDDFREAVACAYWQGGDTDTIGAMTGALVGARVGSRVGDGLPLDRLEDGQPFIEYLRGLAERLSS